MMIVKLEIISLIAHMSCGLETGPSAINDTLYFGLADRLDFDNNVLAFVQKIIEKGIPKADVPPLDPLYIKNTAQLGYWHFPGIVELNKADISNSTILNVGSFEGNPFSFKFALSPPWKVNFTFVYNSIYGYGRNMSVDLIVGDMIPFFTDAEFSFNITDVTIIGSMSIETDSNEYITISSLTADISLGGLKSLPKLINIFTGYFKMNVRLLSLVCLVTLFGQYSGLKLDARSKVCREYGLSSEHCAHLAPAYGVPPLDPLNYEGNVHIENFNFNDLLDIKITDLTVAGQIKPGTRPEGWLYIQDLSLDLQLGGTNLLVTGLMGGSRVTYMASEIVSEAAPQVVGQLGPMLGPQVLTIVNTVMDNIQLTLSDILNCLNGGDCLGQGKYSQS
ncbi:hypothetical protein C0J52_04598 [Blattella germanica]|nr:hypothetical protein C0J52_04598 [Blattella germanica]